MALCISASGPAFSRTPVHVDDHSKGIVLRPLAYASANPLTAGLPLCVTPFTDAQLDPTTGAASVIVSDLHCSKGDREVGWVEVTAEDGGDGGMCLLERLAGKVGEVAWSLLPKGEGDGDGGMAWVVPHVDSDQVVLSGYLFHRPAHPLAHLKRWEGGCEVWWAEVQGGRSRSSVPMRLSLCLYEGPGKERLVKKVPLTRKSTVARQQGEGNGKSHTDAGSGLCLGLGRRFAVDGHQFACVTAEEASLWLAAIQMVIDKGCACASGVSLQEAFGDVLAPMAKEAETQLQTLMHRYGLSRPLLAQVSPIEHQDAPHQHGSVPMVIPPELQDKCFAKHLASRPTLDDDQDDIQQAPLGPSCGPSSPSLRLSNTLTCLYDCLNGARIHTPAAPTLAPTPSLSLCVSPSTLSEDSILDMTTSSLASSRMVSSVARSLTFSLTSSTNSSLSLSLISECEGERGSGRGSGVPACPPNTVRLSGDVSDGVLSWGSSGEWGGSFESAVSTVATEASDETVASK